MFLRFCFISHCVICHHIVLFSFFLEKLSMCFQFLVLPKAILVDNMLNNIIFTILAAMEGMVLGGRKEKLPESKTKEK